MKSLDFNIFQLWKMNYLFTCSLNSSELGKIIFLQIKSIVYILWQVGSVALVATSIVIGWFRSQISSDLYLCPYLYARYLEQYDWSIFVRPLVWTTSEDTTSLYTFKNISRILFLFTRWDWRCSVWIVEDALRRADSFSWDYFDKWLRLLWTFLSAELYCFYSDSSLQWYFSCFQS